MEFLHTVTVQATNDVDIGRKVRAIKRIAAEPIEGDGQPAEDDRPADPPPPPPAPVPYFDVGDAEGEAGKSVWVTVEAACVYHMDGLHIGGGVGLQIVNGEPVPGSGYGKFVATEVVIGDYLREQLAAQDVIHTMDNAGHEHDHYWSAFQFFDAKKRPMPEEFWEFALGGFSIDQARVIEPFPIPSGTELFQLKIEILPGTQPGEYLLTCADEHYNTSSRIRKRNYEFTYKPQGFTAIETFHGKITVLSP